MDQVAAGLESITEAVRDVLERARAAEPGRDEAVAGALRDGIVEVGRAAQALQGLVLALVGEGDRLGIARGGIGPWLATVLDVTEGRARGIAQDARLLGTVPQLERELCSGNIGQDSVRAVARTVKAVRRTGLDPAAEVAETLRVAREQGARAGLERVRALEEHVDPGSVEQRHAQARERSFARFAPTPDGQMHRCEILLDPLRGAVLQAAVELQVAEMIRSRQFDGAETVPDDVRTTEQMNAEAITRMAQVFLDAAPAQRRAHFSLPALAVTVNNPAPEDIPADCARTAFGALIPARLLPRQGDPRRSELLVTGHTGLFNGTPVDRNPKARLASAEQRGFLAWRDRHCRYPGCDRPITFALHAHHRTPYAKGGPTTVENLKLYCSWHHTVIHHG
jgi:HNH endonuclease